MASNTPAAAAATRAVEFDRKAVTRAFARLKYEVGGLVDDSMRSRPFYAASKEEAVAKRDAALKVLDDMADRIDRLKKESA